MSTPTCTGCGKTLGSKYASRCGPCRKSATAAARARDARVPAGAWSRPLVELLREALQEHALAIYCIREAHVPNGGYSQHLADVAAAVVREWLTGQRETVEGEWMRPEHGCDGSTKGCADTCPVPAYEVLTITELSDAALATLRAQIGGNA